jgi:hypothetical protein
MEVHTFYTWCRDDLEEYGEYSVSNLTQFYINWISVIQKNKVREDIVHYNLLETIIETMYNFKFNTTNYELIMNMLVTYSKLEELNTYNSLKVLANIILNLKISEYLYLNNQTENRDTYINKVENTVHNLIKNYNNFDFDFERGEFNTNFIRKCTILLYYHYQEVIPLSYLEGFYWKSQAVNISDKNDDYYDYLFIDFLSEIFEYSLENNLFETQPLKETVRKINKQYMFPYDESNIAKFKNEIQRLIRKYPDDKYNISSISSSFDQYESLVK